MAVDTIKHTEAVGKLLKALDENKSLEHLRMMHDENVRLQQEIKTLRFMSDENDKKLAKYVKDIETSREEAKKTGENLQEERRLRRELDSQAKAAQGRVKVIESKLVEATSELSRMQDFRVEMKPLSADTKERLEALFDSARSLAQAYFGTDFPEDALEEPLWFKIEYHDSVEKQIPLLLTNTTPAKQMRVAAALAILAAELIDFCCQPTYILRADNDMFDMMSNMVKHDPDKELFLRSVLLASYTDSGHKKAAQERIDQAAEHIYGILSGPFDKDDQGSLRSAIQKLCTETCSYWQHIQRFRAKIEAFHDGMGLRTGDTKNWAPLTIVLPTPEKPASPAAGSSAQKQQQNGAASSSGGGGSTKRGRQGPQSSQQQQTTADSGPDLSGIVVWPTFFVVAGDQKDLGVLTKGYVLRESDLRSAVHEQMVQQKSGRRRKERDSIRRRTTSMSAGVDGGESPRDSRQGVTPESFLSVRSGGGQKGG